MDNENEYVENREVEITGVTVTLEQDQKNIRRIRFVGENDITWKPKISKEEFEDGIKIEKSVQMDREQLPQLIKDIAKKVSVDGKAKLKVTYNIFNTTNPEGDAVKYRYITSEKTLAKWELL